MEGCRVYDHDSQITNVFLNNKNSSQVLQSLWAPNSSPSIHGSASMVNFEDIQEDNNTKNSFLVDTKVENCNVEFDKCFHQPDQKRRLSPNQVRFLEKSFEVENKLEPDRKIQLAKEVGLQPRQVAIWFQNRRARYKTKVLERDYDSLKSSFDKLKRDYDDIFTENEKLKNEVDLLTQKLLKRENGNLKLEPCDPISSPLDFKPKINPILSQDTASNVVPYKQDDAASSVKSDVFDSDSPHYTSNVFEQDCSDFSQDEDDSIRISSFLHFPKVEVECCDDDLQPNSCNLGFPVQDQGTWFWQY